VCVCVTFECQRVQVAESAKAASAPRPCASPTVSDMQCTRKGSAPREVRNPNRPSATVLFLSRISGKNVGPSRFKTPQVMNLFWPGPKEVHNLSRNWRHPRSTHRSSHPHNVRRAYNTSIAIAATHQVSTHLLHSLCDLVRTVVGVQQLLLIVILGCLFYHFPIVSHDCGSIAVVNLV
jgi:hypothetical protein